MLRLWLFSGLCSARSKSTRRRIRQRFSIKTTRRLFPSKHGPVTQSPRSCSPFSTPRPKKKKSSSHYSGQLKSRSMSLAAETPRAYARGFLGFKQLRCLPRVLTTLVFYVSRKHFRSHSCGRDEVPGGPEAVRAPVDLFQERNCSRTPRAVLVLMRRMAEPTLIMGGMIIWRCMWSLSWFLVLKNSAG